MREEQIGTRERYWRDAIENGTPEVRADAELRLGRYLIACGSKEVGLDLLRRAAKGSDSVTAPRASWALAEALHAVGHAQAGAEEYSRAAALATSKHAPHVLLSLAARCAAHGEEGAAVGIYKRLLGEADDDQHQVIATAAYRLAQLEVEHRRVLAATRLVRLVLRYGDRHLRARAFTDLADLLVEHIQAAPEEANSIWPEPEAPPAPAADEYASRARVLAAELYLAVIATEDADLAPRAAYLLAELRLEAGESIAAEEGLRAVIGSEHPVYGPMAERRLSQLEAERVGEEVDAFLAVVLGGEQLALEAPAEHEQPLPDRISCLHPHWAAGPASESSHGICFVVHMHAAIDPSEVELCGLPDGWRSPKALVPVAIHHQCSSLGWLHGSSAFYRCVFGATFESDPHGGDTTDRFAPDVATCRNL